MTVQLNIANDFSEFPFGRYPDHGPHNGTRFREEFLIPAMRAGKPVVVDLSGARGLAPSFLEEAFGGLVRAGFTVETIEKQLTVVSRVDPSLINDVWHFIREAAGAAVQH